MLLSEYKSKELVAQFGMPIPEGRIATSAAEAEARCREITAEKYVVKAQIAAGGRGLGGGIRFAATPSSVAEEARRLLGSKLVTAQTGPEGETIASVYVEAALTLRDSFYIGIALDPRTGAPLLLASDQGGVQFEERARMDPDAVRTLPLRGDGAAEKKALKEFLAGIGIKDKAALDAVMAARRAFVETDMLLLEINPFAKTDKGEWLAIDAKISLDGNAAFRHPEFETLASGDELVGIEREAQKSDINLVKLDGNLGVVVNGAGLGLATNDMIVDAGGRPANFMDIRTTATSFDIAKGVDLILTDPNVKVVLVNVHGGGMTVCDTVAEGVAFAYARSSVKPPVVARLAGQNADWGHRILRDRLDRKVPVETFDTMTGAVKRAVDLAKGGR